MVHTLDRHPSDWDTLLAHMLEGVQEALSDASLKQKHYTVREGKLEQVGAEGFRYRFWYEGAWSVAPNTRVVLQLEQKQPQTLSTGMILTATDRSLLLLTRSPLPEAVLATLVFYEDRIWLLTKLHETVLRVQSQQATLLSQQVFNLCPSMDRSGIRTVTIPSFSPRPDQQRAIEQGMESDITIVVGPPGTGKTSSECSLILEYLMAGKTVLLTSLTNQAVDSAMMRLGAFCKESGHEFLIQSHQLVRLGITLDLDGEQYRDITLQGIVNQRLGTLSQERESLHEVIIQLSGECESLQVAHELLETRVEQLGKTLQPSYNALCAERTTLEQREHQRLQTVEKRLQDIGEARLLCQQRQQEAATRLKEMDERLRTLQSTQASCLQKLNEAQQAVTAFRERSFLSRLSVLVQGVSEHTLSVDEQQCQRVATRAAVALEEQTMRQRQEATRLADITEDMTRIQDEEQRYQRALHARTEDAETLDAVIAKITTIEDKWQRASDQREASADHLWQAQQELQHANDQLSAISEKERTIKREVLQQARLIGTTLTSLTTNAFFREARHFDAVILDEASMASLVHVLIMSSYASKHIVCLGDPYQFLPIIALNEPKSRPQAAYWLGTDLLTYRQVRLEDADAGRNHVVLLSVQARMHPVIAAPISQRIYGGRLRTMVKPGYSFLSLEPHPEWPLMLIDTGDVDRDAVSSGPRRCVTKRPSHGTSKYNEYHVQCVMQLVHVLLAQLPPDALRQIAVVTPYTAQAEHIRRALQADGLLRRVHVGTAYRFQSAEYPCLIFDTVEGYGLPISRFFSDILHRKHVPTQATRLINVAHSRAQDKLIYLANVAYIRQDGHRKHHLLTTFINDVYAPGHMDSTQLFEEK